MPVSFIFDGLEIASRDFPSFSGRCFLHASPELFFNAPHYL